MIDWKNFKKEKPIREGKIIIQTKFDLGKGKSLKEFCIGAFYKYPNNRSLILLKEGRKFLSTNNFISVGTSIGFWDYINKPKEKTK